MDIVEKAFSDLYPGKDFDFVCQVKYSKKFNPYNANVKLIGRQLRFNLSYTWKDISEDIKMGLFQSLMLRLFNDRSIKTTFRIDLYNNFLKKLHFVMPKTETDDILEASFHRINDSYFAGVMDKPNLVWRGRSKRTLAHYDLHTDTIAFSNILEHAPEHLLDYVMHHEMLHKKHKFTAAGGRNHFHTSAFKKDEAKFENAELLEKELTKFLRYKANKLVSFFRQNI